MKIYGGFLSANLDQNGRFIVNSVPVTITARSKNEAIGALIESAKQRMPICEGWCNHMADVCEVTNQQLEIYLMHLVS